MLAAVVPLESGCYFLKATDSPERIEPLLSDFQNIVAEFSVNSTTGKPGMKLPEGWVMNPRNDTAMAELISPSATGSVKFTVTVLPMPAADQWRGYLLSNVNRWRGQLTLPEISEDQLGDTLVSVNRSSDLLPGYIFDAVGSGSGSMGGPFAPPPPGSTVSTPPSSSSNTGSQSEPSRKPELKYQLPEGWRSAPGTPFRLATFAVASIDGEGEVTVSMAVDKPLDNAMMWYQQVARESEPGQVKSAAESTVAQAEKFAAALGEGTLYSIRGSEQADAPMLLVASLPSDREDLRVFIKLRGDAKLVESQRGSLMQFAQSIQLQ